MTERNFFKVGTPRCGVRFASDTLEARANGKTWPRPLDSAARCPYQQPPEPTQLLR